jgi:ABC-type uncharacterized transport system permease subunit
MTSEALSSTLLALTLLLYVLATFFAFPSLIRRRDKRNHWTPALAAVGLVVHMASLIQQGVAAGRCPVLDRSATMSFFSWLIVLIYVIAWTRSRMQVLSVILPALAVIVFLTSNFLELVLPPQPIQLGATEQTSLFAFHVTVSMIGVAALFLTFASSVTYLLQDRILKSKRHGSWLQVLPPLNRCDRLVVQSLMWGFPLLTVGIITGSVLSASRTGHFWSWRWDEAFSIVAWGIFAVILWARSARGWRGRKSAYLTLVGVLAGVLTMAGMWV